MTTRDNGDGPNTGHDVLVIRVWREGESAGPFRARMTTEGGRAGPPVQQAFAEPEQVVDAVRAWLLTFAAR